jgi:hypothetical protein
MKESKDKVMITYREQKTTVPRGIDDVIDMYVFAWFVYSSLPYTLKPTKPCRRKGSNLLISDNQTHKATKLSPATLENISIFIKQSVLSNIPQIGDAPTSPVGNLGVSPICVICDTTHKTWHFDIFNLTILIKYWMIYPNWSKITY